MRSDFGTMAALAALCLFGPARASAAKTWTVTSLNDVIYTPPDCTSGTGSTCSLRDAIDSATNPNDNGDTIVFARGLFGSIVLRPSYGTVDIRSNMKIVGPGANLLAITGSGGITVFAVESGVTVTLSGLTIANGNAGGVGNPKWGQQSYFGSGGAIYAYAGSTVTISNCTFTGNAAYDNAAGGGALFNAGTMAVSGSTFYGNTASDSGGAILNTGKLTIVNSTLTGNTGAAGGAIYDAGTVLAVKDTTIAGNNATAIGGGIIEGGSGLGLTLNNAIVAGNTNIDCQSCGTQPGNNLIGGNPELGPLAWNGGTTETMMPLPGSPAIGWPVPPDQVAILGTWFEYAGIADPNINQDQRGFVRLTDAVQGTCVGAVETHYIPVSNAFDSGSGTLRDALTTANLNQTVLDSYSYPVNYSLGADIQINATGTVRLNSTLPAITGILNIVGPGADKLTIRGPGFGSSGCAFAVGTNDLLAISGVTITNEYVSANGAGICNQGNLTVSNSAISGNYSWDDGGGVFGDAGSNTTIYSSTVSGNTGSQAGGIFNLGTMAVVDSTIAGNTANYGAGGGIVNEGAMLVTSSTVSQNSALQQGGGIFNNGTLTVVNSIVAGNTTAGVSNSDDCDGCGTQNAYNLIGGNPMLGQLQLNGTGATPETLIPLPGSPALGKGNGNTYLLIPGLETDERGFPRTLGTVMDYGAVQSNYTSVQFVQQPGPAQVNQVISPAPTVEVLETNNNTGATDAVNGIPVTLSFSGGASEITGSLTQTTANGVATFSGLSLNTAGTGDTFSVASPLFRMAAAATSSAFNVTPPSVSCHVQYSVTTQWNVRIPDADDDSKYRDHCHQRLESYLDVGRKPADLRCVELHLFAERSGYDPDERQLGRIDRARRHGQRNRIQRELQRR